MGVLYDLRTRIDPTTPDDPAKVEKLRKAAADLLQLRI